jgi:hypothetical protein
MNNLLLSFSGADLTRLRTLVSAVATEIAHVPGRVTTAASQGSMTALDMTWSRLVEMLDLGSEPKMRECPECKQPCMLGATRCGHCWAALPSLKGEGKQKEKLAA